MNKKVMLGTILAIFLISWGVYELYVREDSIKTTNNLNQNDIVLENENIIVAFNENILFLKQNKQDEEMFNSRLIQDVLSDDIVKKTYNKKYNIYIDNKFVCKAEGIISNNNGRYIIYIDWNKYEELKQYSKEQLAGRYVYISSELNSQSEDILKKDLNEINGILNDNTKNNILDSLKKANIDITKEDIIAVDGYMIDINSDGVSEYIINLNNYIGLGRESLFDSKTYYNCFLSLDVRDNVIKIIEEKHYSNILQMLINYPNVENELRASISNILDVNNDKEFELLINLKDNYSKIFSTTGCDCVLY